MNSGVLSEGLNDTLVALIPKVKHPEKPSKFRPISFCNVAYKVITKVLTNKIKEVIHQVIAPKQNSFVSDRQIVENIEIFQETLHVMKKKDRSCRLKRPSSWESVLITSGYKCSCNVLKLHIFLSSGTGNTSNGSNLKEELDRGIRYPCTSSFCA